MSVSENGIRYTQLAHRQLGNEDKLITDRPSTPGGTLFSVKPQMRTYGSYSEFPIKYWYQKHHVFSDW